MTFDKIPVNSFQPRTTPDKIMPNCIEVFFGNWISFAFHKDLAHSIDTWNHEFTELAINNLLMDLGVDGLQTIATFDIMLPNGRIGTVCSPLCHLLTSMVCTSSINEFHYQASAFCKAIMNRKQTSRKTECVAELLRRMGGGI